MAKTVAQFIFESEKKLTRIIEQNIPFERAVRNTVALQSRRIFLHGLKSDGSQIGKYSTKPMYVNPNTGASPRKTNKGRSSFPLEGLEPTEGKTGEHIFTAKTAYRGVKGTRAGDPHRTTYLAGGYKELRNRIGRRIDIMNITLTNDLLQDFCNATTVQKSIPKRISSTEYQTTIKRRENQLKKKGLEDRFGKIFNLMSEEKTKFFKTLDFNFRKALADD